MRRGIWIIALLLMGVLSYAQTTTNTATNAVNATKIVKDIAIGLVKPAADILAIIAGAAFWGIVIVGALYGYANYVASSTILGGFFATSVLNWIKEHIKGIMIALAIPFIISFIVGTMLNNIAAAYGVQAPNVGGIIIERFLKSITFNVFG